jgi:hypothetical protein
MHVDLVDRSDCPEKMTRGGLPSPPLVFLSDYTAVVAHTRDCQL